MVKILYWDVETSTMDVLHRTYQLKQYSNYLNHKDIVRDWTMLSCAWAYVGLDEAPKVVSIKPSDPLNDEGIIRHVHMILSDADILVGHNSDRFDLKKFNARLLEEKPASFLASFKVSTVSDGFFTIGGSP